MLVEMATTCWTMVWMLRHELVEMQGQPGDLVGAVAPPAGR